MNSPRRGACKNLLKFSFTCHFLEEAIVKIKKIEGREETEEQVNPLIMGLSAREKQEHRVTCVPSARGRVSVRAHPPAPSTAPAPHPLPHACVFQLKGKDADRTQRHFFSPCVTKRSALGTCHGSRECLTKYDFGAWRPGVTPGSPVRRVW